MPVLTRALPVLTLALAAAFGAAQEASFTLSGTPTPGTGYLNVSAVSHDGATSLVTGYDFTLNRRSVYLWTAATGFRTFDSLPNADSYDFRGLSGDGRTLFGQGGTWAAVWTEGQTAIELEHPLGATSSIATSASYDASVVGGYFYIGGVQKPFRWTPSTGSVALDQGSAMYSAVFATSDDGSTLVGYVTPNGQDNVVCRWDAQGVRTELTLPGAFAGASAEPAAVSADGTITLLRAITSDGPRAFLWEPGGARNLGYVPGLVGNIQPSAISADGSVAVGLNSTDTGDHAFIWDKIHGMRDLRDVLISAGLGGQMGDADTTWARGVTVLPSGAIVVTGNASTPSGDRIFSATIPAEATFDGLGDFAGGAEGSEAAAISADGETVVGYGSAASGQRAFVWTATRGMADLGDAFAATSVSEDGRTVVGRASGSAFNWREDGTGRWLGADTRAEGVSFDGRTTVGSSIGSDGIRHAYRWKDGSTERYTTYIGTHVAPSQAVAVSPTGSVFVGSTLPHDFGGVEYRRRAFRWDDQGNQAALGDLPGGEVESEALAVSNFGKTIVGWSSGANGREAFRWTSSTGMVSLGNLPGMIQSRALALSWNGAVIVGTYDTQNGPRAFVWDIQNGMRDLQNLVVNSGGVEAVSWHLERATGVALDKAGRVYIVGSGLDANGHTQAFRATLPKLKFTPPI